MRISERGAAWRYPKIVRDAYLLPFPRKEDRCALMEFIKSLPCAPEDKSAQSMIEIETAIWSLRETRALILWSSKWETSGKKPSSP